ncbi:hypothetical protein NQ966_08905 [Acinetobacter baumannii]|nr:hypothetical protein [Acinetobacter baumannii]MDC4878212.1 hypothetical protein [Acinetobacter baumannii]MDC5638980.1 hypothetical protein [Acinetobacter baumannii]
MTKSVVKKKSLDIKKPLPAVTGVVRHSIEVNQMNTNNLSNQQQIIQSWFEPALYTLNQLLQKRKENLRRINRDEKNAAVKRDEFMWALSQEHRMPLYHAGVIISNLYRAKKIRYLGSFIQIIEEEEQ